MQKKALPIGVENSLLFYFKRNKLGYNILCRMYPVKFLIPAFAGKKRPPGIDS